MRTNSQKGIAPIPLTKGGQGVVWVLIIALLVIGGGGYAVKKGAEKRAEKNEKAKKEAIMMEEKTKEETARTIQVKLDEQNGSGQSGQAIITQIGTSALKVIVNITGTPSSVAQPAHIHLGSCPNPGAVKYPLNAVEMGAAQTELPMTLDQLLSELPLAVNLHKSAADIKTYVACGNIEKKTDNDNNDNNDTGAMMEKGKEMMTQGEQTMQKKGDAMMQEGAKMPAPSGASGMKKQGDEMMSGGESMMLAPSMVEGKKEVRVTYSSQGFSPKTVTVKKGETVVFDNKTGRPASVASAVHPTHLLYPEFDQYKTAERGKDEFRFSFEKVGIWNYHDHLNASMGGTVVVTE